MCLGYGYFEVDVLSGWAENVVVVVVVERTAMLVEWEWEPILGRGWETEEGRKPNGLAAAAEACGFVSEGLRMMNRQGGS